MNLPEEFEAYTRHLFGNELYEKFRQAIGEESPVSIRLNPFKAYDLESDEALKFEGLNNNPQFPMLDSHIEDVPWCRFGRYLNARPAFTFDPLLHAGLYYVQEASSMFVCEVVRQLIHEPVQMLDLCAAPGGKTTALRSALPDGSLLFANEPIKTRASILKENVIKLGHPDVIVTNNYPKDYRKSKLSFDAILADVPCSGEGMFRKDANAIAEWSVNNVEKCRQLQRSIIEDVWPCLRPGGLLIYSTCTFNAHENEENVDWIAKNLGADFVRIEIKPEWNITGALVGSNPICRFIPGVSKGEGLFMAVLRKHGSSGIPETKDRHKDKSQISNLKSFATWLDGSFSFFMDKDFIRAIPARWSEVYNNVKSKLHVIHAGVGIGTVKGKDVIPDVSLAQSIALRKDAFPIVELAYDDAIKYLRKEAISLVSSVQKGFAIVTYGGEPLGFVKNLGNRANNLYPQEWKIRSSHVPDAFTHTSSHS